MIHSGVPLGTVVTAMVTPMHDDFSIDWEGAVSLLEHLAAHGSDGVVIAGTTGEAPTLTDDEQIELIRIAVETVGDRLCVIAGAGANDTAHAIRLTERSAAAGADAILSVTPYYNRPNARGIHAHFAAVAAASELPVVLYNIPTRTGTDMPDDLILDIAEANPTVKAVKQARPGIPEPLDGLDIYAGDDERFCDALENGAVGGILVASHLVGTQMMSMIDQPATRRQVDQTLRPLYQALGVTVNPIPIKAALNQLGLPSGPLRLPLVAADDSENAVIAEALAGLGLAAGS